MAGFAEKRFTIPTPQPGANPWRTNYRLSRKSLLEQTFRQRESKRLGRPGLQTEVVARPEPYHRGSQTWSFALGLRVRACSGPSLAH